MPNLPHLPNSPKLHNTSQTSFSRVWQVRATRLGKCRRVWRVRATRLGEGPQVWRVSHISEKGHFGEYLHSLNSCASFHCLKKLHSWRQGCQIKQDNRVAKKYWVYFINLFLSGFRVCRKRERARERERAGNDGLASLIYYKFSGIVLTSTQTSCGFLFFLSFDMMADVTLSSHLNPRSCSSFTQMSFNSSL